MALSPAELDMVRAEAERVVLTERAQIYRNTQQTAAGDSLGGGGLQVDWQPIAGVIPCRISKVYRPKPEEVVAGQVKAILIYQCRFKVDAGILPTDRIEILTGISPGLYAVSEVSAGQSEMIMLYVWMTSVESTPAVTN